MKEAFRRLAQLAVEVALDAPTKQAKWTYRAGVRWDLIDRIRAECDAQGIDWRKWKTATREELT